MTVRFTHIPGEFLAITIITNSLYYNMTDLEVQRNEPEPDHNNN